MSADVTPEQAARFAKRVQGLVSMNLGPGPEHYVREIGLSGENAAAVLEAYEALEEAEGGR